MDEKALKDYRVKWFNELADEYDDFSEDVIRDIMNDFDTHEDPYGAAVLYVDDYVGDYAISEAMVSYLTS